MYYQLNGLVLNTRIQGEADKNAIIYTREWGKISAMVPGAKKIKAKLNAATEPVIETDLMVYMAGPTARPKVTGAKILEGFAGVKSDWRRFSAALMCSELLDLLTPFHLENSGKYDLLVRTWKLLENAKRMKRIYTAFALRLLKLSGFSFLEYVRREMPAVSNGDFEAIKHLSTLSGTELDNGFEIGEEKENRIGKYIDLYLTEYIPRPMKSKSFWEKITA